MTARPRIQIQYKGVSYTPAELAKLVGVLRVTIYRWIQRGECTEEWIDGFLADRAEYARRRELGITKQRVYARRTRHGWSYEEATSTPRMHAGWSRKREAVRRRYQRSA